MPVFDPADAPTVVPKTRAVGPDTATAPCAPLRDDVLAPEARYHYRYGYALSITLYGAERFVTGVVRNLSVGGFFVETTERLEVGEICQFDLVLPAATFWCSGRVSWVGDSDRPDFEGMGIEFETVSEDLREALRDGLSHRARQGAQGASSSTAAEGSR